MLAVPFFRWPKAIGGDCASTGPLLHYPSRPLGLPTFQMSRDLLFPLSHPASSSFFSPRAPPFLVGYRWCECNATPPQLLNPRPNLVSSSLTAPTFCDWDFSRDRSIAFHQRAASPSCLVPTPQVKLNLSSLVFQSLLGSIGRSDSWGLSSPVPCRVRFFLMSTIASS